MADKIAVPDRDGRLARNERLEKAIQGGQERRREQLATVPIPQPSTNPLPGQKGLKPANSALDVLKKR
jgi:hypothetical protein